MIIPDFRRLGTLLSGRAASDESIYSAGMQVFAVARFVFVSLSVAIAFGTASPLYADDAAMQHSYLAEQNHTTWTAREGAPQGVRVMAQAPDGTVWIGSDGGLFRFDGHEFVQFHSTAGEPEFPAGSVISVFVQHDGTLWATILTGDIVRIANSRVRIFRDADHETLGYVASLQQSANGTMFAVSDARDILRFGKDQAWHREPTPLGRSGGFIDAIFIDSTDILWTVQAGRLYRRDLSQDHYDVTEVEADWVFGFAEAPDHSLWMIDVISAVDQGRTQHVDHRGRLLHRLPNDEKAFSLLLEPDGSLILATQFHGLRRYSPELLENPLKPANALMPERFLQVGGLSSDSERALLLDADGNMWVGGKRGLDRFHNARLIPFVAKNSEGEWRICATPNGDVWIASDARELYQVSGGGTRDFRNVGDIYAISCGADGSVWLTDHRGGWKVSGLSIKPLPPIRNLAAHNMRQEVETHDHTVFANVTGNPEQWGIWRYEKGSWTKLSQRAMPNTRPYIEYLDSKERLWTGYSEGLVGLPLEGRLFRSGEPGLGNVYDILETKYGLFAAGENGLAVFRGTGFQMLTWHNRAAGLGIGGLVEALNGDLWLNGLQGIVRVPKAELEATLDNPQRPMDSELIREGEFVGPLLLRYSMATAARDAEGHLWFAMSNGVVHFDPERISVQSRPPILSIRSIAMDRHVLGTNATVPPRPQTLSVKYFGVNLTAPDKVIYRYLLDGLDDAWQEAGTRTEAIYTRLKPGKYTFRVSASNGDGVWTPPVSSSDFVVLPSFYQTSWFAALCVVVGALLLWLIITARVLSITRIVRARAEERADERIRISRELHDTLLQGIQGLLLTFHVAAQKVSTNDTSKPMLEKALARADEIIIEGRDRVSRLRSEHLTDSELLESLKNLGEELGADDSVHFQVTRSGIGTFLRERVADEVLFIARESLTNAFRHSGGSRIELSLNYGARYFSMVCQDNGRGFDADDREKPGHWGLKGMAERAQEVDADICCDSKPLCGTKIIVAIASFRAYQHHSRLMFYLRSLYSSERTPTRGHRRLSDQYLGLPDT